MDKKLTPGEAALKLGVSHATILNWQRGGLLSELTELNLSEFLANSHRENRLTSRANKRNSRKSYSPSEYGKTYSASILNLIKEQGWSCEEALFYAVEDLTKLYGKKPANSHFLREMEKWSQTLFQKKKRRADTIAFPPSIAKGEDFPGWLYQTLLLEGEKSLKGSYYTPPSLVEDLLDRILTGDEGETFFDPCCGTGGFLIPAARRLNNPEKIYGQDCDPLAVRLARLNLMRLFPDQEFNPPIYQGDSLGKHHRALKGKKFTSLATNPPWGFRFSPEKKAELSRSFPLTSGESASLFVIASLEMLEKPGRAGFLLPESLLHRNRHRDIRKLILDTSSEIRWYGKRFSQVQSECFALILKEEENKTSSLEINGIGGPYSRDKVSLCDTPLGIWNIFTSPQEREIFQKIFAREHSLLGEESRWGLGIVTGNNKERLNRQKKGFPLLRGREITPFTIAQPEFFLDYHDSRLQQKAPLPLYGEKKIVYRFIASRPVAALDSSGALTLNSVNFLIPGEQIDPELAVLFLNSRLYGLYFEKTFHTLKVLRGQLETLPFPLLTEEEKVRLKELYPRLCDNYEKHRSQADELIYQIFDLTEEEKTYLEQL
jgi:tRNA1(Val) A37 N6-methylase TrmN6